MPTVPGDQDGTRKKVTQPRRDPRLFRGIDAEPPEKVQIDGFDRHMRRRSAELNFALETANRVSPNEALRVLKASSKSTLPPHFVRQNLDRVEQMLAEENITVEKIRGSDFVRDWIIKNPIYAGIKPEKIPSLANLDLFLKRDPDQWPLAESMVNEMAELEVPRIRQGLMDTARQNLMQAQAFGLNQALGIPAGQSVDFTEAEVRRFDEQAREIARADLQQDEEYILAEEPVGFGEAFVTRARENPLFLIPYLNGAGDAARLWELYQATKAVEGDKASRQQEMLLFRFGRMAKAAERRGMDAFGIAGSIMAELPSIAGEFATSGGVGTISKKIGLTALKEMVKKKLKSGVKKILESRFSRFVGQSIARTVVASPTRIAAGTIDRMRDIGISDFDQEGRPVIRVIPKTGKPFGAAFPLAVVDSWAEMTAEMIGGTKFFKLLDKPVNAALFKMFKLTDPTVTKRGFRSVLEKVGVHGVMAELGEERVAELLKQLGGVKPLDLAELVPTALGGKLEGKQIFGEALAIIGFRAPFTVADLIREKPPVMSNPQNIIRISELMSDVEELTQEAPEVVREFVADVAADSNTPFMFIPSRIFQEIEGDEANERAKELGINEEQLADAVRTNRDLKVRTEDAAMTILRGDKAKLYQDEMRTDPNETNQREFEEITARTAEVERERIRRVAGQRRSQRRLKGQIKEKLKKANFTEEEAEANAEITSRAYASLGAAIGLTAQQLFEQRPIEVTGKLAKIKQRIARALRLEREGRIREGEGAFTEIGEQQPDVEIDPADVLVEGDAVKADVVPEATGETRSMNIEILREVEPDVFEVKLSGVGELVWDRSAGILRSKGTGRTFARVTKEGERSEAPRALTEAEEALIEREGQEAFERQVAEERQKRVEEAVGRRRARIEAARIPYPITLLKDADRSTFMHENAHIFLEIMGDLARREDVDPSLKQDFQTMLKHIGFTEAKWRATSITGRKAAHEKFAKTFEQYLLEGQVPTPALQRVFEKFAKWFMEIYRALTALNVQMTPDVRGVFDRLLVMQDELDAVNLRDGPMSLQEDLQELGMGEKRAKKHAEAITRARQSRDQAAREHAVEAVRRRQTREGQRIRREARKEATDRINTEPVYIALHGLRDSQNPDGTPLPREVLKGKLSRFAIMEEFVPPMTPDDIRRRRDVEVRGRERIDSLPEGTVTVTEGEATGVHPDTAAEMYGFESGEALLTALTQMTPKNQAIDQLAEQIVRERMGEIHDNPAAMEEAVNDAMNNEDYAKVLIEDLKILVTQEMATFKQVAKLVRRIPNLAQFKEDAVKSVREEIVTGINRLPQEYNQARSRASRLSHQAFLDGNLEEAFDWKVAEIRNHFRYLEAVKVRAKVSRQVDFARRMAKRDAQTLFARAGGELRRRVNEILAKYSFIRETEIGTERRKSFREWFDEQKTLAENGWIVMPQIPEDVINENTKKHFREMTVEELDDVFTALKSLHHQARLKRKLLSAKDQREFEQILAEAREGLETASPEVREEARQRGTAFEPMLKNLREGAAMHRTLSSITRQMDGYKDGGEMTRLFATRLKEMAVDETFRQRSAAEILTKLFTEHFPWTTRVNPIENLHTKRRAVAGIRELSRWEVMLIALNAGNEGNLQRLRDGEGWSNGVIGEILNTMTKEEIAFVNGVRELLESFWPDVKALAERVDGVAPDQVTGEDWKAKNGTIKGGYFPIIYDTDAVPPDERAQEAAARIEATEQYKQAQQGNRFRIYTTHGHRELRKGSVGLKMRLDPSAITNHITDVLHDLTHYEGIVDMNRILKGLEPTIKERFGNELFNEMRLTLRDVAAGSPRSDNAYERIFSNLRAGTTVAVLGFKFTTALLQPLGLASSIVRLGIRNVAAGAGKWIGDASRMENTIKWVHNMSGFMKQRNSTMIQEINDFRAQLQIRGEFVNKFQSAAMWMTVKAQLLADIPTWIGQFEKTKEELGFDRADSDQARAKIENEAIARADQAVIDTQGSGFIADRARIQRQTGALSLFTMFSTYFIRRLNLARESLGENYGKGFKSHLRLAMDYAILYPFPAALAVIMREFLRGGIDDEEELTAKVIREAGTELPFADIIGLREFISPMRGYRYRGPAGVRAFVEGGDFILQAGEAIEKGETDEEFWRSLNASAGVFLHYPAAQLDSFVRGFNAWEEGRGGFGSIPLGPPAEK